MPLFETASGRLEFIVEQETEFIPEPAALPRPRRVMSVKEAATSGDVDDMTEAVIRETLNFLSEPYYNEGYLNGSVDLSGRPGDTYAGGATDLDMQTRIREVSNARAMAVFSPPMHHAIRLHRCYVIGQGIPQPTSKDSDVQDVIEDFWTDPDNFELGTHIGQAETDARQTIDGELFMALYVDDATGHVKARAVDALDIVDLVSDPNDRRRVLYYRMRLYADTYDFNGGALTQRTDSETFCYVPDWRNTDPSRDPYKGKARPAGPAGCVIAHFPLNRLGLRGVPDAAAGGAWVREHRKFMESRAVITQALSRIALVKTIKGGPQAVNAMGAQDRSSLVGNPYGFETNPPSPAGSTYTKSQGVDLEQLKVDTGAGNAVHDGEMLAQMVGTAAGLPTHYILMSSETQRLATAVSMELPVLKMYEDAQKRWLDMLRDILEFALLQAAKARRLHAPVIHKNGREVIDWAHASAAPKTMPVDGKTVREGLEPTEVQATVAHEKAMQQPTAMKDKATSTRGNFVIDMPPILARDVQPAIASIVSATQAGLLTPAQAAYQAFLIFGVDEVDEHIADWRGYLEQHADQIDAQAKQEQANQQAEHDQKQPLVDAQAGKLKADAQATTAGAKVPSGGTSSKPKH